MKFGAFRNPNWILAGVVVFYALAISMAHFYVFDPITHHGSTLFDLQFEFGRTIETMIKTGSYQTCFPRSYYANYGNYCIVAGRMPIIPLFLWFMSIFSLSTLPALIAKSVVTYGILAWAITCHPSYRALLSGKADMRATLAQPQTLLLLIFILAVLLIPYNAFVVSELDFEEAYFVAPLLLALGVMFHLSERPRLILLGILLVVLIYTKASLWPVSVTLAVLAAIFSKNGTPWFKRAIPLAFLVCAYMGWSGYVYVRTGQFVSGATLSSWGGEQLAAGNNAIAAKIYPKYTPDYVLQSGYLKPDHRFKNEWEANNYFMKKGKSFIVHHPRVFLTMVLKRANVMFFGIRQGNRQYSPGANIRTPGKINFSLLFDRLLLLIAIGICALLAYRRQVHWAPLVIGILAAGAYVSPTLVAFAYDRHVVPFVLVILYTAAFVPKLGARFAAENNASDTVTKMRDSGGTTASAINR